MRHVFVNPHTRTHHTNETSLVLNIVRTKQHLLTLSAETTSGRCANANDRRRLSVNNGLGLVIAVFLELVQFRKHIRKLGLTYQQTRENRVAAIFWNVYGRDVVTRCQEQVEWVKLLNRVDEHAQLTVVIEAFRVPRMVDSLRVRLQAGGKGNGRRPAAGPRGAV